MANKAIEVLKKTKHDLDIEIKMWQKQGKLEVASKLKIEKAQVEQAIEKLCGGENTIEVTQPCTIHVVSGSDSKECKNCKHYDSVKIGCNHPHWDKCVKRDDNQYVIEYMYHEYHYR